MILVHVISDEQNAKVIGACVEGLASGEQVYVTVAEAEKLTDIAWADWRDDLEVIDYRNLDISDDNASRALRAKIAK